MAESVQSMESTEQLLCSLRRAPPSGPSAILDMAREWRGMGESMVKSIADCFSDIECRERNVRLVSESLETRLRDLKEREREFEMLQEGKSEELNLREGKLDEQLRLVHEHIESLERSQGEVECLRVKENEKIREIEKRERKLEFVGRLLEERVNEVETREKEFDMICDGKLGELALKEEVLIKEKQEFADEIKLMNESLKSKQRAGCDLIMRLELALDMLGRMKVLMDERFKEVEAREAMALESVNSRLNEADLIRESLEKRFKELEDIEKELIFSQEEGQLVSMGLDGVKLREEKSSEQQKLGLQMVEHKLDEKKQELELKQGDMVACKKEHDYKELDCSEKCRSSVRESPQTCVKENLALSKLDQCRPRTTDAITIKPGIFVESRHALQKDRETLEMLVNDPEKDLGLMDDEIYKTLSASSDPAKLVLDTVQGFYALPSEKLDTECRVRGATVLLLDQLTKMSPKIQPCVTAEAIKLSFEWKSKISTTAVDLMEVLGFLHLLAAFKLSSRFDKNELFGFLKLVGRHKRIPGLCHALGLMAKIPGYIHSLIHGKEFLLASTYIHEYQMQHKWKHAAILNHYVAHSKSLANAKARSERNTCEAQDKAIARQIADLRVAIDHIIKFGLESEYSPNVLSARIQQLEANRANLRPGNPSPSADIQKQRKNMRSGYPNGRNARRKFRQAAARESAAVQIPQMQCTPAWRAQHQLSNAEMCPATAPPGFPYPWGHETLVPMQQCGPDRPYKRQRPNVWLNGDHQEQVANLH